MTRILLADQDDLLVPYANSLVGDYTLTAADAHRALGNFAAAGALTVTLPAGSVLPVGYWVDIIRHGAQPITIAGAAGVAISRAGMANSASATVVVERFQAVRLHKLADTVWYAYDLTGPVDTGWVDVPVAATFAAQSGYTPQVRRIGKVVSMRGGWASTGLQAGVAATVGTIPAGFRPGSQNIYWTVHTSANAAVCRGVIGVNGGVDLMPGATLATWYLFSGATWLID